MESDIGAEEEHPKGPEERWKKVKEERSIAFSVYSALSTSSQYIYTDAILH